MTVLGFTITFHGPFRVGAAYGRDGVDAAIDHDDPLPADHLKGLMRAAAATMLGGSEHPKLDEVFGSPRSPSPWSWSSASLAGGDDWNFGQRHRVKIDPGRHSAVKDHLVLGERAWPSRARFEVARIGLLDPAAERDHVLILRCAAAAVHGLGAWRRRGLGWVGVTPDDGPVTAADAERLLALAGTRAGDRG
jgi:hypothetical protein